MIMLGAGFGMIAASFIGALWLALRTLGPAWDRRTYAKRYARHGAALRQHLTAEALDTIMAAAPTYSPDCPDCFDTVSEAQHGNPDGGDGREDTETFLAVRGWPVRRPS